MAAEKKHAIGYLLLAILLISLQAGCGEEKPAATGETETISTATTTNVTGTTTQRSLAERQQLGRMVFEQKCAQCHMINSYGATGPGPDLTHAAAPFPGYENLDYRDFFSRFLDNPRYLNPAINMPVIPLTPEEKDGIIEYLMTLK